MSFAKILEFGCEEDPVSVENPKWDAVREAIEALDGQDRDSVILEGGDEQYMGISGGNEGRYVVGGFHRGFGSFLAGCGKKHEGTLDVSVSGDYNPYPQSNVLELKVVVELARIFFESGSLAEDGRWEPQ